MQNSMSTAQVAITATALAASRPDIRQPTIILFTAGIGALSGAAVGRGRRLAREQVRELGENWGFIAGMIGVALYATALMMQVR
jgi:hypothetical protein